MTAIDALLARARLHHSPDVPDDTVPYEDESYPAVDYESAAARTDPAADDSAAEHLHTLCEAVVSGLTPGALEFLTEQLPEPEGAWLLGCALSVAGVEEGARFWWQYAAGAGSVPAAYCLSLHHHARGEAHAAGFWYQESGLDSARDGDTIPVTGIGPHLNDCRFDASVTTVLRVLSRLNEPGPRPLTHPADVITHYVANAVTRGYARNPDVEIPLPGPCFAARVSLLLGTAPPWTRPLATALKPGLPSRTERVPAQGPRIRDTPVGGAEG
jgi:hypothetical protein